MAKRRAKNGGSSAAGVKVGSSRPRAMRKKSRALRLKGSGGPPFAAEFFQQVLPAMVKECACSEHDEPQVLVYLGDGTVLDVHKLIGLAEKFVVVAAFGEGPGEDGIDRTEDDLLIEAVPYDLVLRASVRRVKKKARRLGFAAHRVPVIRQDGPPPEAEVDT